MKMRQSMAALERKFEREAAIDRRRRDHQRRAAVKRTHVRRRDRIEKHQTLRFFMLLGSIALTVVVVTWTMFQALAMLLG
jgi:Flp pilus assembly protein TadB